MEKTEMVKLNLTQRINSAMADVAYVQREEKTVPGMGFRPTSRQAVVAKVRPILQKWGIVVVPSECLKSETIQYTSDKGKPMFMFTLVQGYRVVNADVPTEFFTCSVSAQGTDSSDKGANKALTMTEKQLFINMFHIEIGDEAESQFDYEAPSAEMVETLSVEQCDELMDLGLKINVSSDLIAKSMGCERLRDVPRVKYQELKDRLTKRLAQMTQANKTDQA